jgi:phosphoribosyl-dephospho-CoA transferase
MAGRAAVPTMDLQRHQLVWLSAAGWQAVLAGGSDEPAPSDPAQACLQHWAAHRLPLVVTRQAPRPAGPLAVPTPWLTLGLAAPTRWGRLRLFVRVPPCAVQSLGAFPPAAAITQLLPSAARADWRALDAALQAAGIAARVYGSHGWQVLSGLACVRIGRSDIDLLLPCAGPAQADAACLLLARAAPTLPRLDGECLFADGGAVAWREWAAGRSGAARQVLVKRLHGAALEAVDTAVVAR